MDREEALRAANRKFTRRFQVLEEIARERGWESLAGRPLADLESAWSEAKNAAPEADAAGDASPLPARSA